ncbi:ShKT domain-containing protein [Strongyloides ratti]|uniref:ShKT domain-containing protein n=1 Tax=Strongyloides ratti TaxID=34506 RepID=A0A090LHH2_STRRB|nr:ShKT domain-containing protein [Strongyloides ratti]CEF67603.1 ShKT domain-containing protein [Strongyloides ratti]
MKFLVAFLFIFITLPLEVKSATCTQMANNGYCMNSMYRETMCKSCAAACNTVGGSAACTLPVKSTACADVATNCDSIKYLCTNPTYANLMATKCMSTCNTCDGKPATTAPSQNATTTTISSGNTTTTSTTTTTTTTTLP